LINVYGYKLRSKEIWINLLKASLCREYFWMEGDSCYAGDRR